MKNTTEDLYRQMGIAALLPGLQRAVEVLQAQVDEYRSLLAEAQEQPVKRGPYKKKTATPEGVAKMSEGIKGFWATMTAEERSAEMKRRFAVSQRKQTAKLHPRDPKHPGHAEWVAKMSATNRKYWAKASPQEKKKRIKAMAAGQRRNQHVNGKEQTA